MGVVVWLEEHVRSEPPLARVCNAWIYKFSVSVRWSFLSLSELLTVIEVNVRLGIATRGYDALVIIGHIGNSVSYGVGNPVAFHQRMRINVEGTALRKTTLKC